MSQLSTVSSTLDTPRTRQPNLTRQQQQSLLQAVSEWMSAGAGHQPAALSDPTLGGTAEQLVSGAFVSLKRGKHLRACSGGLQDQPMTIERAVAEATYRTVVEDVRFPVVSPVEFAHLDIEVWLLFNPQAVQAKGEERLRAVKTGGKHGIVIGRGPNRGLLLPGVAVDHEWDTEHFLEHGCIKAGLHPALWRDDATSILTFEGEVIRGRYVAPSSAGERNRRSSLIRPEDLAVYEQFCRANIQAGVTGALPTYYLNGAPDLNVAGVTLSVRRPQEGGNLDLSRFSTRPGVPLQSALFELAQEAGRALAAQRIEPQELEQLEIGLGIMTDTALHGTVAEPDLGGIESKQRAVLIVERMRVGLVYDPQKQPKDLIAEGARQAQVLCPTSAAVFSVDAVATESRILMSSAPQAQSGAETRPAGVAGRFYPADPKELSELMDDLLKGTSRTKACAAAMIPHAGLTYSGSIAAGVFKRLKFPSRVIIIGPKHTPRGCEWAVAPNKNWSLPGATLEADPQFARELAGAIPGLKLDAVAHEQEHAIEVELPFLARLAPDTKVVGIAVGYGDLESCRRFADGLARVLRSCEERPLLLISSDMNHFATDAENRRLDEIALGALESLDPAQVFETVTRYQISMCGMLPAVIVMETLRRLGKLKKAERTGYATSADVTHDTSRVVGYAGMLFT